MAAISLKRGGSNTKEAPALLWLEVDPKSADKREGGILQLRAPETSDAKITGVWK